ncbi:hypothetical protein [Formosa algae]|uniref:Methylmalonyl-CoA mutase n=1 Tax=Formosa algae TaxID=225843 RepID=A0A9X0YK89_9FLAO|nr:hypothetical protein [Formosa algae]MBP1840144.1 methylmalonyl-CoA mutase [Formosa algae]MDQ0335744.1 methylmalonyl-CoA mutase [Formosa algae]OEI79783.1 hypothetical protein AST99_12765 [Formosa algae]
MERTENTDQAILLQAKTLADIFATQEGRRPRLLLSNLNKADETNYEKHIATAYADIGFDVDLAPLFQNPKDIAKQAIENDVHAIHLHALTPKTTAMVSEITSSLLDYDREDILIVVDGNDLSETDNKTLNDYGVHILLQPNTSTQSAAISILKALTA